MNEPLSLAARSLLAVQDELNDRRENGIEGQGEMATSFPSIPASERNTSQATELPLLRCRVQRVELAR